MDFDICGSRSSAAITSFTVTLRATFMTGDLTPSSKGAKKLDLEKTKFRHNIHFQLGQILELFSVLSALLSRSTNVSFLYIMKHSSPAFFLRFLRKIKHLKPRLREVMKAGTLAWGPYGLGLNS